MRTAALVLMVLCGAACRTDEVEAPQPSASAGASSAVVTPLPAALKGYELYAWDESSDVAYALVTGTNRQKTADELRSAPQSSAGDYVNVRGTGLATLRATLARVPTGTEVVFGQHPDLPALAPDRRAEIEAALRAR